MAEESYEVYEAEFFEALNNFRRNPQSIIPNLQALLPMFRNNILYREDDLPIQTTEGEAAVLEAIDVLSNALPLPEFVLDANISNAARCHCVDIGKKGYVSHEGTDGSTVSDRIERFCEWEGSCGENIDLGSKRGLNCLLSFIIDDGVKSRSHRKNLMNEKSRIIGIAMGPHREYEVVLVVNLVHNLREKNKPLYDITNYKYQFPEISNSSTETEKKPKKIKNKYQLDDEDAPDNTIAVRVVKQSRLYNGRVNRVTKKLYTLSDGTTSIVEVEDL